MGKAQRKKITPVVQDGGLIEVISPHVSGLSENNHDKTSFRIAGVPAMIRTEHLGSPECHSYTRHNLYYKG
jgi:hypothetical protein